MFERFKVDLPIRFVCKETQKSGEGKMIDISAGGGGLIVTTEELRPGLHLEIWIDVPDDKDPLYITGVVVWINKLEEKKFRVGVQFEKVDFMSMWRILELIKP